MRRTTLKTVAINALVASGITGAKLHSREVRDAGDEDIHDPSEFSEEDFEPFDPNAEYGWQSGYSSSLANETDGPGLRRLRNVREMLRSLICYDYYNNVAPTGLCPYRSNHYYKALRNYGCNCYPENADNVNPFNGADILWNLGNNGQGIDEVDTQCRKTWGDFQCFHIDGCKMGLPFTYFLSTDGEITCGPRSDPWYESDPSSYRCELAACWIEKNFAEGVYPLMGNPNRYRRNNRANFNEWSNGNCMRTPGLHQEKSECCGEWPNRVTYNQDEFECCSDGAVEPTGFC